MEIRVSRRFWRIRTTGFPLFDRALGYYFHNECWNVVILVFPCLDFLFSRLLRYTRITEAEQPGLYWGLYTRELVDCAQSWLGYNLQLKGCTWELLYCVQRWVVYRFPSSITVWSLLRSYTRKLMYCALKGTVASVWVWLKVVWLERAKIGKEPLSIFKNFQSSFDF